MIKRKYFFIIVSIIFLIIIINFNLKHYKVFKDFDISLDQAYANLKKVELSGTITSVYIDTMNHCNKTISYLDSLKNAKKFILNYDKSGLFYYVKINDIINKEKDSYIVKVIREQNDTLFYLDYGINNSSNTREHTEQY